MYCKNGAKLKNFYENLLQSKASHSFYIILDDFSINALQINTQILQVLPSYKQVVTEPIKISGALLDHAFI